MPMRSRCRFPLTLSCGLLLAVFAAGCSAVRETPPNVRAGGRAFAIAVRPDRDTHLIVASETGGLFRSTNGGATWNHLALLPSHFVHDVAYASLSPLTVVATTRSRFLTVNDGGIWRSTDGGTTWAQPPGALPAPSVNCPSRPSAYGLSVHPLLLSIHVATDCGISRSTDGGATWTHIILDPTAGVRSDSLQHRVWSVSVLSRSSGVAAAAGGLFHLDGGGGWRRAVSGPTSGKSRVFHALAVSPWSASHYFHVGNGIDTERQLWLTTDGGSHWTALDAPLNMNTREPFVRTARASSGDDATFDVYVGTGVKLLRRVFRHTSDGPVATGDWTTLSVDHSDPADIAFDAERRMPILLATDGGLHATPDKGASWKFIGGGTGGYNALQITEVIGQEVTGSKPHLDLYYATQDNDIKGSPDGGATWPGGLCCEGFHLRVPATSVDHASSRVTGAACGGCSTFQTKEHLSSRASWPNPPDGDTIPDAAEFDGTPMHIVGDAYLQATRATMVPEDIKYLLTLSAGTAWSPAFTLRGEPRGALAIGGSLANPTVFQGFKVSGALPNGGTPYGLTRVERIATTPRIERADSVGIGAFGVLKTMFAFYTVYGVSTRDPNRLIAPDVRDNVMKFSRDGGRTWQSYPQLTSAVTDNGRFLFAVRDEPLASVIAFDPYDSCHIIVGTHQRGFLRSTDGGSAWTALTGSAGITYPTSVYFPAKGAPIVSSYGRGLWKLQVSRRETDGNCAFNTKPPRPQLADSIRVLDPDGTTSRIIASLYDSTTCPRCDMIIVKHGWITGYVVERGVLQRISISGGHISQLNANRREVPLAVQNTYRPGELRVENQRLAQRLRPPLRARALLIENGVLRGIIASVNELPVTIARVPELQAFGVESGRAMGVVHPEEKLRIVGQGFLPTSAAPITLVVDGQQVSGDRIVIRADGTFLIDIPVRGSVGQEIEIVAEQVDGRRLTRATASVRIAPMDRENAVR